MKNSKEEQRKALEKEVEKLLDLNAEILHQIDRILFLADYDCSKLGDARTNIEEFTMDLIDDYDLFEELVDLD